MLPSSEKKKSPSHQINKIHLNNKNEKPFKRTATVTQQQ